MSSALDSLNLRPQEKRVIVVIAVVVFVVLNLVLVFPHFKDYGKIEAELKKTRQTIATNNAIIAKDKDPVNGWKKQLEDLEKQQGGVATFKEIALQETATAQARANGVFIQTVSPLSITHLGSGNQSDKFFESQSIRIVVQSAEDALVKFLYNVGNDPAMIRVWELELRPLDNNRYKLNAAITLTADYQKTAAPAPAPVKTAATAKAAAQLIPPTTPKTGARDASTNANPATARRGPPPPVPPAPGRAATPPSPVPPAPGQSAAPRGPSVVPPRPPRTPAGG
jgi:cell division protein FtsL